jgi:CheY-like chemotaxis protein/anti-sigma regulatory factor (Ser/Thr protein kinase)
MTQQAGAVIDVRLELAPHLESFGGIESEIREALTNLIFNSVDAMPEGGTLTLRSSAGTSAPGLSPARYVQLEVIDTGTGMDEDTRRRCLEPFFTTKGERGTGLGLAMVYGVVRRHSADLEIDSAPGKGTTIRIKFAAAATVETESLDTTVAPTSSLKLLVVDDDPSLIKSLRDVLEGEGHDITTASGGQEAVDLLHATVNGGEPFSAVITDLGMPHVDGRRVASTVKMLFPGTRVILLTGWGQKLIAEGDVPPHVDQVLSKPPRLADLRRALAQVQPADSQPRTYLSTLN